jgi:hypothetical protein
MRAVRRRPYRAGLTDVRIRVIFENRPDAAAQWRGATIAIDDARRQSSPPNGAWGLAEIL